MPKVRWAVSYGFCSKFHTLLQQCKSFANRLRFDKVIDTLRVGTFFETQCISRFLTKTFAIKFLSRRKTKSNVDSFRASTFWGRTRFIPHHLTYLWTKVHEVLEQCRGTSVVCNAVSRLCITCIVPKIFAV